MNHISQFVNELCQLIAGRATTRAMELRTRSPSQINPDHAKEARAAVFEHLADQFKELGTVADSPALINELLGDGMDEFEDFTIGEDLATAEPGTPNVIRGAYVEPVPTVEPVPAVEPVPEAPTAA